MTSWLSNTRVYNTAIHNNQHRHRAKPFLLLFLHHTLQANEWKGVSNHKVNILQVHGFPSEREQRYFWLVRQEMCKSHPTFSFKEFNKAALYCGTPMYFGSIWRDSTSWAVSTTFYCTLSGQIKAVCNFYILPRQKSNTILPRSFRTIQGSPSLLPNNKILFLPLSKRCSGNSTKIQESTIFSSYSATHIETGP